MVEPSGALCGILLKETHVVPEDFRLLDGLVVKLLVASGINVRLDLCFRACPGRQRHLVHMFHFVIQRHD